MLSNGLLAYAMSPLKYVQQAVANCSKHLQDNYDGKYSLPKCAPNPFMMDYAPELDQRKVLTADLALYYQSLTCKIGRVDIITEVSSDDTVITPGLTAGGTLSCRPAYYGVLGPAP